MKTEKKQLTPASETEEQQALVRWANFNINRFPELKLLHKLANEGKRSYAVAKKIVAEGLKAGMPDLHLPVARGKWHSLYIEMKKRGGRTSTKQKEMIELLRKEKNMVVICEDWLDAAECIKEYLLTATD